ncbi:MAG: nicotinamide-nucleotide amidohydrolase family protein [Planctomycetes bacterium]|nr:nicotinamide-nucleotide amidohydrolase family protein [Planctomycetota bacterium]
MGIDNDQLIDLVRTTLKDLPKGQFEIAWDSQEFEFCRIYQQNQRKVDGGTSIQRNIVLDETGAASYRRLYDTDQPSVENVQTQIDVPWTQLGTNYSWDVLEIMRNKASGKGYIDLLESRRLERLWGLAELIEGAFARAPAISELAPDVSVAYLPDLRGVDLRLTAHGIPAEAAQAQLDHVLARLEPVVDPWRFRATSGDIVESVSEALRGRSMRLATAESCTAGLMAKRITDLPGASDVYVGGVVAYDDAVKEALLQVPEELLSTHGAVSGPVAIQMARGVARRLGAAVGVAVTGIAGPGGGTDEKPVGTVWLAVSRPGSTTSGHARFVGDRHAVRERAAQAAFALLLRSLQA